MKVPRSTEQPRVPAGHCAEPGLCRAYAQLSPLALQTCPPTTQPRTQSAPQSPYMAVAVADGDARLAEAVAGAVLARYAGLPKNGKPGPTEWTILAGLAASRPHGGGGAGAGERDDAAAEVAVVALATGSKCLSASKLRPDGRALHDSHAEVLARRSLVHFLQTQLLLLSELGEDAAAASDDCILEWARPDAPGPRPAARLTSVIHDERHPSKVVDPRRIVQVDQDTPRNHCCQEAPTAACRLGRELCVRAAWRTRAQR